MVTRGVCPKCKPCQYRLLNWINRIGLYSASGSGFVRSSVHKLSKCIDLECFDGVGWTSVQFLRESLMQSTNSFLANFIACYAEMEDWMICGVGVALLFWGCLQGVVCVRKILLVVVVAWSRSRRSRRNGVRAYLSLSFYNVFTTVLRWISVQLDDVLVCVGMIERLLMSLVS